MRNEYSRIATPFTHTRMPALVLALLAAVLAIFVSGQAQAQDDPPCPASWPGAVHDTPIEYEDFYQDHDFNRWFIIRSRSSNGYVHIRAYPEDDRYAIGYTPGEACTLIVRRPGDDDLSWSSIEDPIGAEVDYNFLGLFYLTTGGDDWKNDDGWLTDRPIGEWYGVTTDAEGYVVGLNLRENGLVADRFPPIFDLTRLKRLELWGNEIAGPLPAQLGNMTTLEYLDLDDSKYSGSIPPELGNLSNLTYLGLDQNQLTGPIPPELGRLSNLTALELHENQLTGPISPELGNLLNLEVLALFSNDLTGSIPPELGNLIKVRWLLLSHNRLSGPIPTEFGSLDNLGWLALENAGLSGEIPQELADLPNLFYLTASGNEFTGCIPPDLQAIVSDFYLTELEFCAVP